MNAKKWIGAVVLVAVVVVLAVLAYLPRKQAAEERAHLASALRSLDNINDFTDLDHAVAPLGMWFTWSTNEWLAVQYGDGTFPDWSLAIARDSEGRFFRSRERFGGAMASYLFKRLQYERLHWEQGTPEYLTFSPKNKKRVDLGVERADPAGVPAMKRFHDVSTSTNLAAGRAALQSIGFEPFDP
tara:strand:- start:46 stop:600 length:555 start_codon:yes stop_codon:yes gene_type:complete